MREYRPFKEARAYVRRLGLKSQRDWKDYGQSGKKPADIPTHPHIIYSQAGWVSMGDWLGTGRVADHVREYRSFTKARAFVQRLGLKSQTGWKAYCRSGKRPADIPANPNRTYAEAGWSGWGDWLGTGAIAPFLRKHRPFKEARAFVRTLDLKSQSGWKHYCKSGKKPDDIPANPHSVYAKAGWASMADWLGAGRFRGAGWRPFKEARAFVRSLGLKSGAEWREYCKSGKKPNDIPSGPKEGYADAGWVGMRDWLGIDARRRIWRRFPEARSFVQSLGLNSGAEWLEYCASGRKPADIPSSPDYIYKDAGWAGMGDWLGTSARRGNWRRFSEARAFVRNLELKSKTEWHAYTKSGKKPNDIPATPHITYAEVGWAGLGDWLGYVRSGRHSEARSKKTTAETPGPADVLP